MVENRLGGRQKVCGERAKFPGHSKFSERRIKRALSLSLSAGQTGTNSIRLVTPCVADGPVNLNGHLHGAGLVMDTYTRTRISARPYTGGEKLGSTVRGRNIFFSFFLFFIFFFPSVNGCNFGVQENSVCLDCNGDVRWLTVKYSVRALSQMYYYLL